MNPYPHLIAAIGIVACTPAVIAGGAGDAAAKEPSGDVQVIDLDRGSVVVYADGRVFRRIEQFIERSLHASRSLPGIAPQPVPSGYERAQLTARGLTSLWDEAEELGMLVDEPDYGDPGVTDSAYSELTVQAGDQVFQHRVYAPGWDVEDDDAQERRERYARFAEMLVRLDEAIDREISDFEPWVPDAWVLSDDGWFVAAPGREWPLDDPPTPGACVILPSDEDQDTATGAYLVRGTVEDHVVVASPLLPGETCRGTPAGSFG